MPWMDGRGWLMGWLGLVGVGLGWVFLFFFRMAKHFENAGVFDVFGGDLLDCGLVGSVFLGVCVWFQQFLLVGWMLDREGSLKFKLPASSK